VQITEAAYFFSNKARNPALPIRSVGLMKGEGIGWSRREKSVENAVNEEV